MTETEWEDFDGRPITSDVRHLKREARAVDEPSAEERAFQEGWDAAYSSIDEAAPRAGRATQGRPQAAPRRPRGFLSRYRESVTLFGGWFGVPTPRQRARR